MTTTVIFAHPYRGSFNRAILDRVQEALHTRGREYALIDLYADNFDPVLREEELAVYSRGGYLDPQVKKYNDILDESDEVILIFPIWWYDFPAILKGFFDKAMLEGSAYHEDETGMHPLRNIGRTLLVTTSSAPTAALVESFGDTINRMMIGSTFRAIGLNGGQWLNLGRIGATTPEERAAFLEQVAAVVGQTA